MSWRRNAFRVSDYLTPTSTMKFQFIASDSTIVGANLDGGSLVEAAVDDFVVYDALIIGVKEEDSAENKMVLYPNPTSTFINLNVQLKKAQRVKIQISDATGRIVFEQNKNLQSGKQNWSLEEVSLAEGVYKVILIGESVHFSESVIIQK